MYESGGTLHHHHHTTESCSGIYASSSMSSSMLVSSSSPRLSATSDAPPPGGAIASCSQQQNYDSLRPAKPFYRAYSEDETSTEMWVPPVHDDDESSTDTASWQLLSVTLRRVPTVGFGIAVSGGRDNPHFTSGDPAVVVSDVVPSGPAWGLVQVNDRILSANGVSLENAEYAAAVQIMKESHQLNMIVKRRAPIPLIEFEQRTLKFTLSKSRKKEDFGIVLGCKYYIKEITNRKLAEKDPGLREGDTVLRINGQSVDGISIEEATKWLVRSREKLSLVVQRDVRRGTSRWPSQTTVYERLGSVSATPRHSPSPMLSTHQPLAQRSSSDYVNNPVHNARWPQSDQQSSTDYGEYYRRNGSISSSQGVSESGVRVVSFRKVGGSLGVRVIGGNRVGIFVSAVQDDSPAAQHSIRPGERILAVNEKSMVGVTREEAVRHLLSLSDDVTIKVEYAPTEFEQIRNGQLGDDFYIRTHFPNTKVNNQLELTFHNYDIFHITDTLFGGTVGLWQATRVYSAAESASGPPRDPNKGVIPNSETAERLMKAIRASETSTLGRSTFFRRKLKERRTKSLTKNAIDDVAFSDASCDVPMPAYERVVLTHPPFRRPVVLYGPLADIARQMLLANFALCFASARDQSIVRLSSIDAIITSNKHCVLDVSPGSVERLHLAQYAPIVILIDVESRARIRELRAKAGAPSVSSRKLIEQMHKIKKHHSHLFTATLDASKEDGWFDALRQLIEHLQNRRVWMPEFRLSSNPSDVILLPMQSFHNASDSDVDSLKGDYSSTDYGTKMPAAVQGENDSGTLRSAYDPYGGVVDYGGQHVPRAFHLARSQQQQQPQAQAHIPGNNSYYQNIPRSELFGSVVSSGNGSGVLTNPRQPSLNSPARRLMLDSRGAVGPSPLDAVPWATLPRRHHVATATTSNSNSSVAANTNDTCATLTTSTTAVACGVACTTNSTITASTNCTNNQQPQQQQPVRVMPYTSTNSMSAAQHHSPIMGRRLVGAGAGAGPICPPPPHRVASPALSAFTSGPAMGSPRIQLRASFAANSTASPYSPSNPQFRGGTASPSPSPSPIRQQSSSPAPLSPPPPLSVMPSSTFSSTPRIADSSLTPQPTSSSHGYYDVKQILAEQSSDYYGRGGGSSVDMSSSQHYQSPLASPYVQQMQTFAHEQQVQPVRAGLFYDHLTRNRWNAGGGYSERRSIPGHGPGPGIINPGPGVSPGPYMSPGPGVSPRPGISPGPGTSPGVGPGPSITPVHFQPLPALHAARPSPSPHHSTAVASSDMRYADESPKSPSEQPEDHVVAVSNGNATGGGSPPNDNRSRIKTDFSTLNETPPPKCPLSGSIITAQDSVKKGNVGNGEKSIDESTEATVIEHVSEVVDSEGCTLSCPESGVMLVIPKGAIDQGVQQEIYVKVCRANGEETKPPLDESRGESLMSPLVMCGPQDLHFNVPVELRLPHSASNNGENWSFALKSGTGEKWNQITLDGNNSSLVTDKFACVKICHF